MKRLTVVLLAAVLLAPPTRALAQAPPLSVRLDGGSATVLVGPVLDDAALEDALRSGIPLRLRFRVELWRERFFDELIDHLEWAVLLAFEPIEGRFLAAVAEDERPTAYPTYAGARAAIERSYRSGLGASRPGRYYYLTALEIESLSLSDLEELGHWLRGELSPAIQGRRSLPAAVGTGLRRAFIRVLRLPARQYRARSEVFQVP